MAFWNRLFKRKSEVVTSDEAINVVQSIAKAKVLYKALCIKCHPDKFPHNKEKQALANELFQELQKCKHNIEKLKELEIKINELLNTIKVNNLKGVAYFEKDIDNINALQPLEKIDIT